MGNRSAVLCRVAVFYRIVRMPKRGTFDGMLTREQLEAGVTEESDRTASSQPVTGGVKIGRIRRPSKGLHVHIATERIGTTAVNSLNISKYEKPLEEAKKTEMGNAGLKKKGPR